MKKIYYLLPAICILLLCAGAACKKERIRLSTPQNLIVEGKILYWDEVRHARGYVVDFDGSEKNVNGTSFDFSSNNEPGTYRVQVMALGDGIQYDDSGWASISVKVEQILAEGNDNSGLTYRLLKDESGYEVLRGKNQSADLTIPDYFHGLPVKQIASDGFAMSRGFPSANQKSLTSLILPKYLEEIGAGAFVRNEDLTQISIPDSVTAIGDEAFFQCGLEKVQLPKNLKTIGMRSFFDCKLKELELPEGLEYIRDKAFSGGDEIYTSSSQEKSRQAFESVVLPASVKRIEYSAFSGNTKLKEVTLLGTPEYIGADIFKDTAWYSSQPDGYVFLGDGILYAFKGEFPESSLRISAPVKAVASSAFSRQSKLEEVSLAGGIRLIGGNIFGNCKNLSGVRLPDDLTEIPDSMFSGCESLKRIDLPKGLKAIGMKAFQSSGLEEITLPEGFRMLGDFAFQSTKIKTFVFPEGMTDTGDTVFRFTPLEKVTLPKSLKNVGMSAFMYTNLKELVLPDGLETFAMDAVSECKQLTQIVLPKSIKEIVFNIELSRSHYDLEHIFYQGSLEDWLKVKGVDILNPTPPLESVCFYSPSKPKPEYELDYWRYVDGVPTKW